MSPASSIISPSWAPGLLEATGHLLLREGELPAYTFVLRTAPARCSQPRGGSTAPAHSPGLEGHSGFFPYLGVPLRSGAVALPGTRSRSSGRRPAGQSRSTTRPGPAEGGGGGDRDRALHGPAAPPQPGQGAVAHRLCSRPPTPLRGSPPPAPTPVKPSAPSPGLREGQRGARCLRRAEAGNGPRERRGPPAGSRDAAGTRSPARAAPRREHPAGPMRRDCPDTARHGAREGGGAAAGRGQQPQPPQHQQCDWGLVTVSYKSKAFAGGFLKGFPRPSLSSPPSTPLYPPPSPHSPSGAPSCLRGGGRAGGWEALLSRPDPRPPRPCPRRGRSAAHTDLCGHQPGSGRRGAAAPFHARLRVLSRLRDSRFPPRWPLRIR